mmetsp:Transcript_52171/g.136392  ORF Transcript_52171/g.136392 Transcript_52171/m.136392 type:complete len:219 (-) Transcript_52171:26-682(-)
MKHSLKTVPRTHSTKPTHNDHSKRCTWMQKPIHPRRRHAVHRSSTKQPKTQPHQTTKDSENPTPDISQATHMVSGGHVRQQQLQSIDVSMVGGQQQRRPHMQQQRFPPLQQQRLSPLILRLHIICNLQQPPDSMRVAFLNSEHQRCLAVMVSGGHVRVCRQQQLHSIDVSMVGGHQQRRPPILILRLQIICNLQQPPDSMRVAFLNSEHQRCLAVPCS